MPHPKIAAVARAIESLVDDDCDGMSANEKALAVVEECDPTALQEFVGWFDGDDEPLEIDYDREDYAHDAEPPGE